MAGQNRLHRGNHRRADGDGDHNGHGSRHAQHREGTRGVVDLPGRARDQAQQQNEVNDRHSRGHEERGGGSQGIDQETSQGRADEHAQGHGRHGDAHHLAPLVESGGRGDQGQGRDPRDPAGQALHEARRQQQPVGAAGCEQEGGDRQDDDPGHEQPLGPAPVNHATGEERGDHHGHGVGGEEDSGRRRPPLRHGGQQREHRDRQALEQHIGEEDRPGDGGRTGGEEPSTTTLTFLIFAPHDLLLFLCEKVTLFPNNFVLSQIAHLFDIFIPPFTNSNLTLVLYHRTITFASL